MSLCSGFAGNGQRCLTNLMANTLIGDEKDFEGVTCSTRRAGKAERAAKAQHIQDDITGVATGDWLEIRVLTGQNTASCESFVLPNTNGAIEGI
jgi:hypothetical protein